MRASDTNELEEYIADRAPLFYRSPDMVLATLEEGYFLTAIREVIQRIPTSTHFQNSHFGEILSAIFAQELLGWELIYSKLRLTTSENTNPHKMDLLFYDPSHATPTFILGEVKSSMKSEVPARHNTSCYPSLFNSMRGYSEEDLEYDLTAARDNINSLQSADREKVRQALLPYSHRQILYAGFAVIDYKTQDDSETVILASRSSSKEFDVDLVCVDRIAEVSTRTYEILDEMRNV